VDHSSTMTFQSLEYGAPPPAAASAYQQRIPWGFAEIFVISQTALPALLYLPGTQPLRLPIRVAAFVISLAAFAWWLANNAARRPQHKAYSWIAAVMMLLGLMLFHRNTLSLYGGFAHMMLYFAVIAPFFWAPSFVRTPEQFARLLGLLLICSGINSVVGVLQVYRPETFMPAELSRVITEGAVGLGPVTYQGPNGKLIVRPPGLFDTPGAVSGPAMFAALLGVVFGLSAMPAWMRLVSFAFSAAGIAAIYLTQVRVSLAMTILMFIAYAFVLTMQRRASKATTIAILGGILLAASFALALTLGGQSVTDRFATLFAGDPFTVYYNARGVQLSDSLLETVFEYPFGAGLGRWGMAAGYFGVRANALWAEIQITGWLIDGGIPLIVLYSSALYLVAMSQFKLARITSLPRLAACAAVVFALSLGPIAMSFSFTPFVTQIGIQFWFLAGALHGVACSAGLQDA
jgi:hypothetical protein